MKNTLMTLIAAIALLVALSPLQARAAVTVYADEAAATAAMATQEAAAATNPSTTGANQTGNSAPDRPPVSIDQNGIHVGGPNPVDISVPSPANHHTRAQFDVVAMTAVMLGCAIPIAIVGIVYYFNHRRLKIQHETMRAMIEKGMPIPPELLAKSNLSDSDEGRPRGARNDLRGGLILVGVGAGLLMIAGKVGWILVFIGAARLVLWLIEDRKT